jgi:flagellar motor protein MotB
MNEVLKPRPAETTMLARSNPQLEAFRNDLRGRLQRFGVSGVDVDIRTAQDGQQRVAVVLQNSFRPGSASLSYNAAAVKAVVGVGKLIGESYAGSRVTVEGHTDSDPIKKSKWDSNEALSLARAEEVKKLLRQAGVGEAKISAVGMGARQPVAKGATERAKAQNRRVEIFIYPAN